jgi:putative peptidoglycan lipid II flippase
VNLLKAASTVSLLTLASRVTGLVREQLMAAAFGASAVTDAFNVAFRIPNLLRRLFAEGAFSQAFVPLLAASRQRDGDDATRRLVDAVATVLWWALLATVVVGVAGAPVIVWLMASGLAAFDEAVFLTRLMFPYIACMSLVALAAGVLNTWQRFAVPAATPVLLNLSWIAAAWWGAPWFQSLGVEPIYAVAAGVMVGGVLQLAVQWHALRRVGMAPRLAWRPSRIAQAWSHPGVGQILRQMAPALLGVSVAQVSLLINTQIASHLAVGSVSWLTYADRLMEFPTALLGVALGVVLLPRLSAAQAGGDAQSYSGMLDWGLRMVVLLALPCAVALMVFAEPLVAVLYHYGRFSPHDAAQTVMALQGYGVGLLGLIAIKVLAPGFYARQDVRTPVRIAVVVLVITQGLNVAFVPWLGHAGLALSIGLAAMINAAWLLIGLLRAGAYLPSAGWGWFLLRVLLACGVLAGGLELANRHLDWLALQAMPWARASWLALIVAAAAAVYFSALRLLGLRWWAFMRRAP